LLLLARLLVPRLLLAPFGLLPDRTIVVAIVVVDVVAVLVVAILVFAALVALEPFLHLRLGSCDDAVVVFRMLQVVLRDHPVAGTLRVTCKCRVLLGNMLSRTTDFHIGAGTVVGAGKRVAALAIEVVIATAAAVVAAATPSTALVLLSWPHRLFT